MLAVLGKGAPLGLAAAAEVLVAQVKQTLIVTRGALAALAFSLQLAA